MPRIIQPANSSEVLLIEGDVLSLDCTASGDPAPVITWTIPIYTQRLVKTYIIHQVLLWLKVCLITITSCMCRHIDGHHFLSYSTYFTELTRFGNIHNNYKYVN